jgi:ABC-type transport system substrate-binding protein
MQPLAMNEYIQQNLAEVGIKVEFETMEWQSLLDRWRAGAKAPENKGASAINVSYATVDPFSAFVRFLRSDLAAPAGVNWGYYSNQEMDDILAKASGAFNADEQNTWLQQAHRKMVDEALFLFVVHDVAPRALAPKVKGFVQAQSWFQDLTPVTVQP